MSKYICLRDDDTSFVTRPDDLVSGYGEFWGKIPVTLATIPFVHSASLKLSDLYKPGQDKYKALREYEKSASAAFLTNYYKTCPVGDNTELIDMLTPLIKDGIVEIAQHGVFHKYSESGPEMLSSKMSYESIRDAKEYLEKVFGVNIFTFIPPSNTIDVQCVKWLKQLDLHLMTSGSISRNDDFRKIAFDYLSLPRRIFDKFFATPWSLRPMNHQFGMYIFSSSTFGESTDYDVFLKNIKGKLDRFGYAAIGTHYSCFSNKDCRNSFWKLLETLSLKEDVVFLTANQYYHSLKKMLF